MPYYMGSTDAAKAAWMATFAAAITLAPNTYGLVAGDATAINAVVTPFVALQATGGVTGRLRNNPATYTPVTVQDRIDARNVAVSLCAQYAMAIRNNAGVSDFAKVAAGVNPINNSRSDHFVPNSVPLINIISATPGSQTLVYADSTTPDSKAKPLGAVGLQVFTYIGVAATNDPSLALYHGTFAKSPVDLAFDPADNGKIASHFARWVGRRGDVGPWSAASSMTIAF